MNKQERLNKLYKECIDELNSININVEKNRTIELKINTRSEKRYACCKKVSKEKYLIEVSEWVMNLNEDIIKNTIMHELIHCMPRCNNHGEFFKKYAELINKNLGYNVTRTGNIVKDFIKSNLEFKEKPVKFRYQIICENEDQQFFRQRIIKNFTRKYRCGKCGGKFKIISLIK